MCADTLAVDGGKPVRGKPMPHRGLITSREKAAAMKVFDRALASGEAFGYNGPYEKQYEDDFVAFMGGGFADAVNSGTNALYVALGALGLEPFSEVILPPITDPGGIMPVPLLNLVPVVADADPRTYNTCAAEIERMITPRTKAIVVAHIGGEPVDMDAVMDLARSRGLAVVEDCAQAHGARYKGRLVGTLGDIAAFSTMFGKHHCTGGQGGVVYTRNEELFWRAKRFADRGKPMNLANAAGNVTAGLNCNLNDLSAAIGSVQLKRLPRMVEKRRKIGEAVKAGLKGAKAVSVGWQPARTECSYWFLRIHVDVSKLRVDKLTFCKAVAAEGLAVNPAYKAIPADMPWFKERRVFGTPGLPWTAAEYKGPREPQARLTNAFRAVETHFNIAMHESFRRKEAADIVKALRKVEAAYLK